MAKATHDVAFGSPVRGKAMMREAGGRRCVSPGCNTVLSTYNHAMTCFTHTAPERRTATYR